MNGRELCEPSPGLERQGAEAREIRRRGIEVHTERECEGGCTTKRKRGQDGRDAYVARE